MTRRSGRGCFARLLILLIIVIVGAMLVAPYVPLNRFKPQIESILSRQLGRKVTIGRLHLSLSRGPAVIIEDLEASEDPAFGSGNTIEAGTVRVGLSLARLVEDRQVVASDLRLEGPHITFNRNSQGAWSWSTLGQASGLASLRLPAHRSTAPGIPITAGGLIQAAALADSMTTPLAPGDEGRLRNIELKHASITFAEGGSDKSKEVTFDNIDLRVALSPRPEEPERVTRAVGKIHASSEKTESTELLGADLPL